MWPIACPLPGGIAARAGSSPTLRRALPMGFEMTLIGLQLLWTCDFASLPDRASSEVVEVVRQPYSCGMHWIVASSGRPNRHQVCST